MYHVFTYVSCTAWLHYVFSNPLRNAWSPLKGYSLHLVLGTLASAGSLYLMTTPCGNMERSYIHMCVWVSGVGDTHQLHYTHILHTWFLLGRTSPNLVCISLRSELPRCCEIWFFLFLAFCLSCLPSTKPAKQTYIYLHITTCTSYKWFNIQKMYIFVSTCTSVRITRALLSTYLAHNVAMHVLP